MRDKLIIAALLMLFISSNAFAGNLAQKYQLEKSQTLSQIAQLQVGKIALQKQIMQLQTKVSKMKGSCSRDSIFVNVAAAGVKQAVIAGMVGGMVTAPTYSCQELKDYNTPICQTTFSKFLFP